MQIQLYFVQGSQGPARIQGILDVGGSPQSATVYFSQTDVKLMS